MPGVVITGGEPTLQAGLNDFIANVKALGYAVKLDTNGSHPPVIEELLAERLIDFIAMDVKAPWSKYEKVAGCRVNCDDIKKSITIIQHSGIEFQFRTTVAKPLLNKNDVHDIREMVYPSRLFLQACRTDKVLNPEVLSNTQYTEEDISKLQHSANDHHRRVFLDLTKMESSGGHISSV